MTNNAISNSLDSAPYMRILLILIFPFDASIHLFFPNIVSVCKSYFGSAKVKVTGRLFLSGDLI